MDDFELVLILSIIICWTQRLTGEGKELLQNGQEAKRENLNGSVLLELWWWKLSTKNLGTGAENLLWSPAPAHFASGLELTPQSYGSSGADLTWCKPMQWQAPPLQVAQRVLATWATWLLLLLSTMTFQSLDSSDREQEWHKSFHTNSKSILFLDWSEWLFQDRICQL